MEVVGLIKAVLSAQFRPLLEGHMPDWLEARWWETPEQLVELSPLAEIGWFDLHEKAAVLKAVEQARGLKWLNSIYSGMDYLPLEDLHQRGVILTNGSGLNAIPVSEFIVTSMLSVAKNYPAIVRAQDRHEWLGKAPGTRELAGSKALIIGNGQIGRRVGQQLSGFDVEVISVSRSGADGTIGPDQWRARLGEFDWIVLAIPGTDETAGMIGRAELAVMKREAILVNYARASCVDQQALVEALSEKRIEAAILDLTDPEPLPSDHPLWALDNAHITMHLSGRPTSLIMQRAAERFLANLDRYYRGERPEPEVDPLLGY